MIRWAVKAVPTALLVVSAYWMLSALFHTTAYAFCSEPCRSDTIRGCVTPACVLEKSGTFWACCTKAGGGCCQFTYEYYECTGPPWCAYPPTPYKYYAGTFAPPSVCMGDGTCLSNPEE